VTGTGSGFASSSVGNLTTTVADRLRVQWLKPAARFLRSSPWLTAGAIVVLGLGFGLSALGLALL